MQSAEHRAPLHEPAPHQPAFHETGGEDVARDRQRHPAQGRRERRQTHTLLLRRRLRSTHPSLTNLL